MPLTRQETDGSDIKPPHLFWNLEVEPMNRCENSVAAEVKQQQRLLSLSVDLAQQSQSAYCHSDICFTLYKI